MTSRVRVVNPPRRRPTRWGWPCVRADRTAGTLPSWSAPSQTAGSCPEAGNCRKHTHKADRCKNNSRRGWTIDQETIVILAAVWHKIILTLLAGAWAWISVFLKSRFLFEEFKKSSVLKFLFHLKWNGRKQHLQMLQSVSISHLHRHSIVELLHGLVVDGNGYLRVSIKGELYVVAGPVLPSCLIPRQLQVLAAPTCGQRGMLSKWRTEMYDLARSLK